LPLCRQFFRSGGLFPGPCGAALPCRLKKDDRARSGDVEGSDLAAHGNAQEVIAGAANQVVQARAFASEDDYSIRREIEAVVILGAALIEAHAPQVVFAELLERANHVDYAGEPQMLGRACRGFYRSRAERRGTAFRKQDAVHSGSFRAAQQSAEVLRVLDTVQGQHQARLRAFEEVFEVEKRAFADRGDDSLVRGGAREAGEGIPRLQASSDPGLAAEVENRGEAMIVSLLVAFAGEADVVEATRAGAQGLLDRVQAVQKFHDIQSNHDRESSSCLLESWNPADNEGVKGMSSGGRGLGSPAGEGLPMDVARRMEKLVVASVFRRRISVSDSDMSTAALELAQQIREENALVAEGLKKHDPEVLDGLIVQYQHRLLRYLLFLTGNRETAEDLFQETWMRVLVRGSQFNGNSRFDTWLFTIARNLVIDLRRRKSMASLDEICESGDEERPFEFPSADKTPFEHLATLESGRMVTDALLTLDPLHREVLVLRFHEELSLEEIARVTRAPLSTVKSRLYRGLAALKPYVKAARDSAGSGFHRAEAL
jgi:RNA polymerase sigma-70 factor, ECF subfamily